MKSSISMKRFFEVTRFLWARSPPTIGALEEVLGTTILGVLPPTRCLIHRVGADGKEGTAYRILSSNLALAMEARQCKCIGLIPAGKRSSEPVIGLNMATAFANQGRRVLMIDLSGEFSGLHLLLDVNPGRGLTNDFSGGVPFPKVIQKTQLPGIDVITAGSWASKGDSIDELRDLRGCLNGLSDQYHVYLILCPSLDSRTKMNLFKPLVDAFVCVMKFDTGEIYDAADLPTRLKRGGTELLGVILDDVEGCEMTAASGNDAP